jgi:hypothetical protein
MEMYMGERNITHNLWRLVYPLIDCDEQHALIYLKNTSTFQIICQQIIYYKIMILGTFITQIMNSKQMY